MSHPNERHGQSNSPTWKSWRSMRDRCGNPGSRSYSDYGGRGISVCERWNLFENFLADMGERPSRRHSIDRYPNTDGNYEPTNCRWATPAEQARNRRSNRVLNFRGESKCVSAWADAIGIDRLTLQRRLYLGWSVERALTTPLATQFSRRRK
ncbi:hypothetical protein ACTJK4_14000 [Ralstonia sp. 22111]|uniref:hypothetical protein n=1 Tax=Ralstonia sp. 22111 TaxID=3453878 RepID=UPI003F86460B